MYYVINPYVLNLVIFILLSHIYFRYLPVILYRTFPMTVKPKLYICCQALDYVLGYLWLMTYELLQEIREGVYLKLKFETEET